MTDLLNRRIGDQPAKEKEEPALKHSPWGQLSEDTIQSSQPGLLCPEQRQSMEEGNPEVILASRPDHLRPIDSLLVQQHMEVLQERSTA